MRCYVLPVAITSGDSAHIVICPSTLLCTIHTLHTVNLLDSYTYMLTYLHELSRQAVMVDINILDKSPRHPYAYDVRWSLMLYHTKQRSKF